VLAGTRSRKAPGALVLGGRKRLASAANRNGGDPVGNAVVGHVLDGDHLHHKQAVNAQRIGGAAP